MNTTLIHVRKSDANVTDHRYRFTAGFNNKERPTYCGKTSTDYAVKDHSRRNAACIVLLHGKIKPEWVKQICPECLADLEFWIGNAGPKAPAWLKEILARK